MLPAQLVKDYQLHASLQPDGILGPITSSAMVADAIASQDPRFHTYRASLGFLVQEEGHAGYPYQPGRSSGVTLDPGLDLGWHPRARQLLDAHYGFLGRRALDLLRGTIGMRGRAATNVLPTLAHIQVDRTDAAVVLPELAAPFWHEVVLACPEVLRENCPSGVHAAFLSLAYNAGGDDLAPLQMPLRDLSPADVAHVLRGIDKNPERRHREARLIDPTIP